MRLLTACLLCALALPATAQIYKYTDANGNTVFTNQPPEGQASESVELKPTNTVEAQQPTVVEQKEQPSDALPPYSDLILTDIPTEEALRANNGTFSVQVEISPKLAKQHRLQLLIDGQAYGATSTSTSLQVDNLERGEHRLAVQVLANDQVVQSSAEQTITVQRVHTGSPALRPKPTPRPAP